MLFAEHLKIEEIHLSVLSGEQTTEWWPCFKTCLVINNNITIHVIILMNNTINMPEVAKRAIFICSFLPGVKLATLNQETMLNHNHDGKVT